MTTDDVFRLFVTHYAVMTFMASLGVVQIGAAAGGLRGMLLLPDERIARWVGVALVVGGFAWFYLTPLWVEGPWSSEYAGIPPGESPERITDWGTASLSDFARARNVNDIDGGLSGGHQAGIFALAALAAIGVSLTLGAVVQALSRSAGTRGSEPVDPGAGLELLKTHGYYAALPRSLRHWRRRWRGEIDSQWNSDDHSGGLRDLVGRRRSR